MRAVLFAAGNCSRECFFATPRFFFWGGGLLKGCREGGKGTANMLFALANYKAGKEGGKGFGGQRKFVTAPFPQRLLNEADFRNSKGSFCTFISYLNGLTLEEYIAVHCTAF